MLDPETGQRQRGTTVDNQDIQRFFEIADLLDSVERFERGPNVLWQFQGQGFPMFIQTQENVNRMRIVAYIAEEPELEPEELQRLLEANYHSALDARYALTEGDLVSVFIHPLRELTLAQFVLSLYQTIHCAETWGTTYSGGTLVFGAPSFAAGSQHQPEGGEEVMATVVEWIKQT